MPSARWRESGLALLWGILLGAAGSVSGAPALVGLEGEVVDEETGQPLPSRVYIRDAAGQWHFPRVAAGGSAVVYRKQNWVNTNAVEMHTTLSAHPFAAELPAGDYLVTVERGKEYLAQSRRLELRAAPVRVRFALRRWVNMAERGWYSGDTHVHRGPEELPNLLLAEDLNVAFPLSYWVTQAFTPPGQGDKNAAGTAPRPEPIQVDPTHVFYPMNTEYEIFTVGGKAHTLGAVFVLNHRSVLTQGLPPGQAMAAQAHQEGALLDLDKHDWPWSMALAPALGVDLYELANNHIWRTEFGFTNWTRPAPAYMGLPRGGRGGDLVDWIHYGLRNYYALLNSGFRLRPTAGTASGVHPVPLGFGRVYVYLGRDFSYPAWVDGLRQGRSFVTTGPMLLATVEKEPPGHVFSQSGPQHTYGVSGEALFERPLDRIELVVNGQVAAVINPRNKRSESGVYASKFKESLRLEESGWLAVRCFEPPASGRASFAHTGPFYIEVPGRPLLPRKEEVAFLIQRVEEELQRSREVLPPPAVREYEQALAVYQEIARRAR